MRRYEEGKKVGIVEFKSQQKIIADHQLKTAKEIKKLKQRINQIQYNNDEVKEKTLV